MLNNDKLRSGSVGSTPAGAGASGLLFRAASHITAFALGFLLAKTPLAGMFPFAAALISAIGRGYVFTAALGAAAACVFPPDGSFLHILAAALAACAVRRTLSELYALNTKPFYPAAAAFFSVCAGRLVYAVHYGDTAWTYTVSAVCEAMLSAACAFFFSRCFSVLEAVPRDGPISLRVRRTTALLSGLSVKRKGACLFTVCVFLVPLCRLTVGGFSPFSMLVLFASVLAARYLSPSSACLLGAAAGAVLSAASGNISYAGICASASLLSSLFAPLSGILCACVFSSVCVAASLSQGSVDVFFIIGSLLAGGAGAAVPYRLTGAVKRLLAADLPADRQTGDGSREDSAAVPAGYSERIRADTVSGRSYFAARRLRAAADGLSGMSEQVLEVSSRLDRLDAEEPRCPSGRPAPCEGCGISSSCWGELAAETGESVRAIKEKLDSGRPAADTLSARCPRWGELVAALEKERREQAERERIRRRISHFRAAVSGQLGSVSELLSGLADDICSCRGDGDIFSDEEKSRIFSVFERFGCDTDDIYADFGQNGRFTASLAAGALRREYLPDMIRALSEAAGRPFESDAPDIGEIIIKRRAPYKAVFGACQTAKRGAQLCGDSYSAVLLDDGTAAVILSDGMGTGGRAAIDAAMTCGLMERLLRAGFDARGAMGMVNSALMLRAEDEPLATVDCLLIDLFSGRAAIEKAGAAASFIRQGRKISAVSPESLPLGIMDSVDSARAELSLNSGDTILIVSDGVVGDGRCGWIEEMLSGTGAESDMRVLARAVVERAGESCDDDLTAVAVRIELRS